MQMTYVQMNTACVVVSLVLVFIPRLPMKQHKWKTSIPPSSPSFRWSHDPMASSLVCPEGRDLHVVSGQAGLRQIRLALQERRRNVHLVSAQLEDALVRSAGVEAHVLWEWQRREAERNHRCPHSQVRFKDHAFLSLFFMYFGPINRNGSLSFGLLWVIL